MPPASSHLAREPRAPPSVSQVLRVASVAPPQHEAALGEHRALRTVLDRIRRIAVSPSVPTTMQWLGTLERELGVLNESLLRHFAHEEEGGYFADVLLERPQLARRVRMLGAEHALMARELETLLKAASSGNAEIRLAARLVRFLDRLDAHEHAENTILQEAFTVDLGG